MEATIPFDPQSSDYQDPDDGAYREERICYVCGTVSKHEKWGQGLPNPNFDLDGRPDWDHRMDKLYAMEMCPDCGYIAFDISKGDERIRKVVGTAAYQARRKDPSLPCGLLLGALLVDPHEDGDGKRCLWQIWAAWTLEDGEDAIICRRLAATSLSRVVEAGDAFFCMPGKDMRVIADLLRQCGDFQAAAAWTERALAGEVDESARLLLLFELNLIATGDLGHHVDWEAPGLLACEARRRGEPYPETDDDDVPQWARQRVEYVS